MADGKQVRGDALTFGFSPRFTAVGGPTKVRDGEGVLVAVTLVITAAAGATIQLFDGTGGQAVALTGVIDATKGPITLWFYRSFTNSLYITIAGAVVDCNVITSGI